MTKRTTLLAIAMSFGNPSILISQHNTASTPTRVDQVQSAKSADYNRLSNRIFSYEDPESQKVWISEKSQVEDIVSKMHQLIAEQIIAVLRSPRLNAVAVADGIEKIQGPTGFAALGSHETNTPFADLSELNGSQILTVCYSILRGSAGIPDTLPFLEFYRQTGNLWELKATTGSDLTASTLFVRRLKSSLSGENWFLVWGNRLGDTGARLNVRLYSFNGDSVRTVYRRNDLIGGKIHASDRSINLEYDKKHNAPERDRVHEILYVTPNGLQ